MPTWAWTQSLTAVKLRREMGRPSRRAAAKIAAQ